MQLQAIHHWSVTVTDVSRAKAFYEGVLGLQEVRRPSFGFPGAWYQLPDGGQVHLIENPRSTALRGVATIDARETHLAFRVQDWEEAIAELRSKGVEVIANARTLTGWKQAYVVDPDGNVIELNAEGG